jgi:hypothetical protein
MFADIVQVCHLVYFCNILNVIIRIHFWEKWSKTENQGSSAEGTTVGRSPFRTSPVMVWLHLFKGGPGSPSWRASRESQTNNTVQSP